MGRGRLGTGAPNEEAQQMTDSATKKYASFLAEIKRLLLEKDLREAWVDELTLWAKKSSSKNRGSWLELIV